MFRLIGWIKKRTKILMCVISLICEFHFPWSSEVTSMASVSLTWVFQVYQSSGACIQEEDWANKVLNMSKSAKIFLLRSNNNTVLLESVFLFNSRAADYCTFGGLLQDMSLSLSFYRSGIWMQLSVLSDVSPLSCHPGWSRCVLIWSCPEEDPPLCSFRLLAELIPWSVCLQLRV